MKDQSPSWDAEQGKLGEVIVDCLSILSRIFWGLKGIKKYLE